MLDSKHTFNKHIEGILHTCYKDINFYPEPNKQKIIYPAVVLHWGSIQKTNTLGMWQREVQFDILFTDWQRERCDRTFQGLMESLKLAADIPGHQRRIPKLQYVDPQTGKPHQAPVPYLNNDSDIQWEMNDPAEQIEETDKPELMRMTFSLTLKFKNR